MREVNKSNNKTRSDDNTNRGNKNNSSHIINNNSSHIINNNSNNNERRQDKTDQNESKWKAFDLNFSSKLKMSSENETF